MWIFTAQGFFTFVTDRKDPSYLWLRARMREHLEDNFPGIEVTEHPGADYLFRAKVKRADVAQRIAELVMDSRIDSHFKDEFIKTAAKPKTGSLSNVMYAVWRGAAEWQPYAPYSKVPRGQEPKFTYGGGKGAGSTFPAYSSYNGRAADYDWNTRTWKDGAEVGEPAKDPSPIEQLTDEEFEDLWASLSPEEQSRFLDDEEEQLRAAELAEEHPSFSPRWLPSPATFEVRDWAQVEADRREADRQRAGALRGGRKGKGKRGRKNRHNQQGGQQ